MGNQFIRDPIVIKGVASQQHQINREAICRRQHALKILRALFFTLAAILNYMEIGAMDDFNFVRIIQN